MDKPANDNGPMGKDALSGYVRFCFANILRVMRGHGKPLRVLHDIENIATETRQSRDTPSARGEYLESVLAGLYFWHLDDNDQATFHDRAEQSLCEAALRLIAAKLDQNRIQLGRARQDLWDTCNTVWEDRNKAWHAHLEAKEQTRRAESAERIAMFVAASAANDNVVRSAGCVESYVYFLTDGEAIKIGKATDPKSRLSGLQTSNHRQLTFLALTPGDEALERELHDTFKDKRIRGEWFQDCPEIRTLIDDINAGRYVVSDQEEAA